MTGFPVHKVRQMKVKAGWIDIDSSIREVYAKSLPEDHIRTIYREGAIDDRRDTPAPVALSEPSETPDRLG